MAGFNGYYYKHQKDGKTVSVITGSAGRENFVQVVTNEATYSYNFDDSDANGVVFSGNCLSLALPGIQGDISYGEFLPPSRDVMGPFRHLPMQCKHEVVSMRHELSGRLNFHDGCIDFDGGVGYIEGDRGRSFPACYTWVHCNDFSNKGSVMMAIADIPITFFKFLGCIALLMVEDKEYRFGTYLGAKVVTAKSDVLCIKQGKYVLEALIEGDVSHELASPLKGKMTGRIRESNSCKGVFRLYENSRKLYEMTSENVSYENEGMHNYRGFADS